MFAAFLIGALTLQPVAAACPADHLQASELKWSRRPTAEDLAAVFPMKAQNRDLQGRGIVSCVIQADGSVTDCAVITEAPDNYGFGQATIRLTSKFKLDGRQDGGANYAGRKVLIKISYRLPGHTDLPPTPPGGC